MTVGVSQREHALEEKVVDLQDQVVKLKAEVAGMKEEVDKSEMRICEAIKTVVTKFKMLAEKLEKDDAEMNQHEERTTKIMLAKMDPEEKKLLISMEDMLKDFEKYTHSNSKAISKLQEEMVGVLWGLGRLHEEAAVRAPKGRRYSQPEEISAHRQAYWRPW
ncbi:hypothetical protein BX600DRAFT_508743 [Xylariales sp. PMI_506]|nr:hypothetical protein BX600DRAFT_508743 [Xylariales sp. PMI_506]